MKRLLVRRILLGLAAPAAVALLRAGAVRLHSRPGTTITARRLTSVADGIEGLLGRRRSSRRFGVWGRRG